jgi:hypothetical protein
MKNENFTLGMRHLCAIQSNGYILVMQNHLISGSVTEAKLSI